jgi:hypothetical protein
MGEGVSHEEVCAEVLQEDDHDDQVCDEVPQKVVDDGRHEHVVVAL